MKHLPLKQAYKFGAENGIRDEVEEIRRTRVRYKSYTSSVRRGLIIEFFERHSLFDRFKNIHWSFGDTDAGKTATKRYRNIRKLRESRKSMTGAGIVK
jgi:hypothetical protein